MSDRRAEIEMELEWLDAQEAFIAAKETRDSDPEGYAAAKAKMSELRTAMRLAGEANGTRTPVSAIAVTSGDQPEATEEVDQ